MSVLLPLRPNLGGGLIEEIVVSPVGLTQDMTAVAWLFFISMSSLIAPKLFAYAVAMMDRTRRRAFGGHRRTLAGVAGEIVMSVLIAPVMMLSQTRLVFDLLLGRDSGWNVQQRSEDGVSLTGAIQSHTWHTVVGIFMSILAWRASPVVFLWLSPVLVGLLLSIPISAMIARRDLGLAARAKGWLLTPEETAPPEIVVRANQLAGEYPLPRPAVSRLRPAAGGTIVARPAPVSTG
jgi:membrane glycosyltransferase